MLIFRKVSTLVAGFVIGVAGVIGVPSAGAASPLLVPAQYATIQAAIDAAAPGDTIEVSTGTYFEQLSIDKTLQLRSEPASAAQIIGGGIEAYLDSGETVEIRGFVIADSPGNGIYVSHGSALIAENTLTGNGDCVGMAVYAYFSTATVVDNEISNNHMQGCSGSGGAIYLGGTPTDGPAYVARNLIHDNDGGMLVNAAGEPVIESNDIYANTAYNWGGGITVWNRSDALIRNNVFFDNTSTNGAGAISVIVPSSGTGPSIVNNTFDGDVGAEANEIEIRPYADGQGVIANNIFAAGPTGPAVQCDDINGAIPLVTYNLFEPGATVPLAGTCAGDEYSSGNLVAALDLAADRSPLPSSPAVDRADDSYAPGDDRYGTARPLDGNNDGVARSDIGAIEVPPPPVARPIADAGTDREVEGSWPLTSVTLDGSASSDPADLPLTYAWTGGFSGGTANGPTPLVTFGALGTYPVQLTVSNGYLTDHDEAVVTVVDTTAPVAYAELAHTGNLHGKTKIYVVGATCADSFDQEVAAIATVNGESVQDGDVIHFRRSKKAKVSYVDGVLEISAPSLDLTVTCTDDSGNEGVASASR